jgi:hypothetical protein
MSPTVSAQIKFAHILCLGWRDEEQTAVAAVDLAD